MHDQEAMSANEAPDREIVTQSLSKHAAGEVVHNCSGSSQRPLLVPPFVTKSGNALLRENVAFYTLNGDVLHEVVSYLHGRDALNLSLTAHRVHTFAIHRVGARLVCRTAADLRCIHHHLLQGRPKRAVYLRSLTVIATTFIERPWQDDPNWVFPETTFEYSLAPLLADILEEAPGLTHLLLEHFAQLVQYDRRIGMAIASMSRIASLELCQTDPQALMVFQTLRSRPTHLRISTVKSRTSSEAKHLLDFAYDVLGFIASIKELRVLDLDLSKITCRPFKVPVEPRPALIPLPHVHRLSVHWFSQLVDLAPLFPNLDTLEQHINSFHFDKTSGQPLRRLSITEHRTQGSIHHPVHLLHLRRYPRDPQSFLRTIGETSPVGLALHAFVDTAQWIQSWEQLSRIAPRLKFMDVRCHMWERAPQPGWVGRFIDNIGGYSLVCLRIVAPQPPLPDSGDPCWATEDIHMLAELPERLLPAIPTLRYIAWAAKGGVSECEWYEEGYDCAWAEYRWFRIGNEQGGRTLKEIPAWEGERVRQFLLDSGLDEILDIDVRLSLPSSTDKTSPNLE